MQLAGDLTAISIADLIQLLHGAEWEGTVRVRRGDESALFVLQGGLILFPLPKPRPATGPRSSARLRRLRKREELRGNKRMIAVCRWDRGSFRCFKNQTPRGFIARRTLVVRLERLRKHCTIPTRTPTWGWEACVGLTGALPASDLPALTRLLAEGHCSGVLRVSGPRAQLEILIHGKTTYIRRPSSRERLMIAPSETVKVTWKPRPVPEVGLRPERYVRANLSGRTPLQVA
ncbi:MAG: DUF4388 domain-containing protein [Planctomycetes bacterium]|nr:DUF4388 domain-containing protein [Planctomycetota bacterium]